MQRHDQRPEHTTKESKKSTRGHNPRKAQLAERLNQTPQAVAAASSSDASGPAASKRRRTCQYNNTSSSSSHNTSTKSIGGSSIGSRIGSNNLNFSADSSDVTIKVNHLQRGNPLLKWLSNVPWAYSKKIDADYQVGRSSCVLFLSVKYHMLHPKYLLTRMGKLRSKFSLRVLLCQVDRSNDEPLLDISRLAFVNGWTLICAWSAQECARYVETLKAYEIKSADSLKKKIDKYDKAKVLEGILTTIRSVNTRDVNTLTANFATLDNIMQANMESLAICPGLGPKKVKRIYQAFRQPFKR